MIRFQAAAKSDAVSEFTRTVLERIRESAGLDQLVISSTQRTPRAQAAAMFHNIVATSIAAQMALYRAPGQAVVKVFASGRARNASDEEILNDMERAIVDIGAEKVSRHCADPKLLNVVDVPPSSIDPSRRPAFEEAVDNEIERHQVSKFLKPPLDPAYHIEIPQPQAEAQA